MTSTTADPLAAELEAIREMAAQITGDGHTEAECASDLGRTCTGHDAERLARAVQAALAVHHAGSIVLVGSLCAVHENHRHFSIRSYEAADVTACPDCSATVFTACVGCGGSFFSHCPTRKAITAELLREVPG